MTLGSGNIGREGCGGVRTDGRQERYARPSDAHVGRPAAYVDPLLIGGQGGVHHIWACDDCKTTPNAMEFKRVHKKRTDTVKDAMTAVACPTGVQRSEEHTSELQSPMRLSYAVICLKKTNNNKTAI